MTEAAAGHTPPTTAALPRPLGMLRRLQDRTTEERVLRVTAFGFLPTAVVFGLLAVPDLHAQAEDYPVWWTASVLSGVLIAPMVMGALAALAPIRSLQALAAASAATALLGQASLPLVNQGPPLTTGGAPWIDDFISLGAIVSVLAVRPVWATLIAFSAAGLTVVDRWAVTPGHQLLPGVQNGLYVFLFCITFISLGVMTLQRAREADLAEAAATDAATVAAVKAAREREQARINALVHDRVLATLLAAARPVPGSEALRRTDAVRALEGLRALLGDGTDPDEEVGGEAFAWSLQAATTELAPEAVFGYEVHSRLTIPVTAAEALTAAAEEALRNSLLHSHAVNRTVHVQVGDDGVQVDVLDDGVGFETDRVPPARLGIAESIRGRMEALPGGAAVVVSTPRVGTRVQLRYHPERSG